MADFALLPSGKVLIGVRDRCDARKGKNGEKIEGHRATGEIGVERH